VILLLQGGGFMLLLLFQQQALKSEIHSKMNRGEVDFEQIVLSKADYQKALVEEGEILIDGKLFDIQSETIIHNKIVLSVVFDEKEDDVVNEIKSFIRRNCRSNKSLPDTSAHLFSLSFIGTTYAYFVPLSFSCELYSLRSKIFFSCPSSEVFTPPPQLIA
jgi:hypothetical protein